MFRKILKTLFFIILSIFLFVVVYLLSETILSKITTNYSKNENLDYEIFIKSNGVHTDVVLPIKSDVINWFDFFNYEDTLSKRDDFLYISIGWGDKGFYLDTPTWAELKPSTAFKAAFWLGESAMHCTYYFEMKEGDDCKKIMLTKKQYQNLVKYIKNKFDRDKNGKVIFIPTDAVYGINDAFYDAKGKYSFFETCNTWANDGLKEAGQKAALWTPSDLGIFQHYD